MTYYDRDEEWRRFLLRWWEPDGYPRYGSMNNKQFSEAWAEAVRLALEKVKEDK